jgi:uncharacterized LabA/DUF88 family protein
MTAQFARGPQPRSAPQLQSAPHAALLIDFDNVTMGIRSDLTKELKNLLNSDIIKGKVAVQRAYADWRRYPQYIVPLAENSVDLIFAPAYGSSKKNATDIRLAIDALELVFTRAEIGTFILLSGDSDFSSLVLKLKEYGKYVIGVGIRESSSDLLVQNCDEYYSYSGLTGLTRAGDETPGETYDPWELVEIAVRQMVDNRDVMRSDRLKQILLELDPNFDEKALGFTKFNKFVQEASTRGLLYLKKMENGQFEVGPAEPQLPPVQTQPAEPQRARVEERPRPEPREEVKAERKEAKKEVTVPPPALPREEVAASDAKPPTEAVPSGDGLRHAYELLQRATSDLTKGRSTAIRDSDVKRRMLELRPGFDEGAYGFSKFSRFLRQAHDAEVVNLQKIENGSYEVTLGNKSGAYRGAPGAARHEGAAEAGPIEERGPRRPRRERGGRARDGDGRKAPEPKAETEIATPPAPTAETLLEGAPVTPAPPSLTPAAPVPAASVSATAAKPGVTLGFRRGSRGGATPAGPPPILAGQTVQPPASGAPGPVEGPAPETAAEAPRSRGRTRAAKRTDGRDVAPFDFEQLPLPTAEADVIDRLAAYKGVGRKSAEALVQAFGAPDVFRVLNEQPDRVRKTLGARRAQQLLKAWQTELAAHAVAAPQPVPSARKSRPAASAPKATREGSARASKRTRRGRPAGRKKAGSNTR